MDTRRSFPLPPRLGSRLHEATDRVQCSQVTFCMYIYPSYFIIYCVVYTELARCPRLPVPQCELAVRNCMQLLQGIIRNNELYNSMELHARPELANVFIQGGACHRSSHSQLFTQIEHALCTFNKKTTSTNTDCKHM